MKTLLFIAGYLVILFLAFVFFPINKKKIPPVNNSKNEK